MRDEGTKYEKVDQQKQVDGPKQHSGHIFGPRRTNMGASRALSDIVCPKSRRANGFDEHDWLTLGSIRHKRATACHDGLIL